MGQEKVSYFENLSVNGPVPYNEMVQWCDSLSKLGEKAIPLLIEDISRDERIILGLGRAHLSSFPAYYWGKNYRGIRSAYFIEFLLSTGIDYRSSNMKMNDEVKAFVTKMHNYYVYQNNVLLKKHDSILDSNDIKRVKLIYEEWWDKNKSIPFDELKVISKNKPILQGSKYYWK